jgi:ABC-type phosphate/phosphonate transport system substrate-binding protein
MALILASCALPGPVPVEATATASETMPPVTVTATATAPPPFSTVELGLAENPLILALPPSTEPYTQEQIAAARVIASQFTERTGYTVVTVSPDSYTALVEALANGNAHIVLLNPYAYELAYQRGLVRASYAVLEEEEAAYGAQFLATRRGGFSSYFDATLDENLTEEAAVALQQFTDKKPCWSDETSPSGYVIPLG